MAPCDDPKFPTEILTLFEHYLGKEEDQFEDLVSWHCRNAGTEVPDPAALQETLAAHSRLVLLDQIITVSNDFRYKFRCNKNCKF